MPIIYLVQPNSNGKVKYLSLLLEGNRITKGWGIVNGKGQTNFHDYKPINKGKSNELTPEEAATKDLGKILTKKQKEGYVITESLDELPTFVDPFDFDLADIPKSFCCSKPTQTIEDAAIDRILQSGHARVDVKYNGLCHYILIRDNNEVQLFTRRWDDHTLKYPNIVMEVQRMNLPAWSLFITEFCIDPLLSMDHMLAFKRISKIQKSDTLNGECKPDQSVALELQVDTPVKVAVFGVLYYGGEQTWHMPYIDIEECLWKDFKALSKGNILFLPQRVDVSNAEDLNRLARKHKAKLEGFILWDTRLAMEVTMNGKPKRRAAWKIKVRGEMDVIAYNGLEGKIAGEYGSIEIGRYNDKGELVPMGSVSGLKPKEGETKPVYWNFPQVIEVTYDNIFPDTGYLQFGNFSKIHEDKTMEEVDRFTLG